MNAEEVWTDALAGKNRRRIGLVLGLIFFILFLQEPFSGLSGSAQRVLGVAALMVIWWVAEALPMAVVALLPLLLFPSMGLGKMEEVAAAYANPIIFLFMGGFLISLAIEKWDLHKRIALNVILVTGSSGNRILLGFIISTGFLSMWLSNTATTMMMFPIALSVIAVMKHQHQHHAGFRNFSLSLMLIIAYAANFGGVATLIGTPPNVAYSAFVFKHYGIEMPFAQWFLVGFPISIGLLLALYLVLTNWLFPNRIAENQEAATLVKDQLKALGAPGSGQKRTALVFGFTALCWMLKSVLNWFLPFHLDDTMIGLFGGLALFLIPSGNREIPVLLSWQDTEKMAWGILLMFGGGMALANGLEKEGMMTILGHWLGQTSGSQILPLVLAIIMVSIFLSEVMSNVAQVIVLAPVVSALADATQINPFVLGIPMTIAASCSAMMPLGTPPNAIVFASNHIPLREMMKAGFVMNLVAIVILFLASWLWIPLVFSR